MKVMVYAKRAAERAQTHTLDKVKEVGTSGNVGSAVNSMPKPLATTYTLITRAFNLETGVQTKDKRLFLESLHSFLDKEYPSQVFLHHCFLP